MATIRRFVGPLGILLLALGLVAFLLVPGEAIVAWALLGGAGVLILCGLFLNLPMILNMLRGRPVRYGIHSVFYALVVFAIICAVNFLASRHNRRFDFTSQGLHTLSAQTVKILDKLDEDVSIMAFYMPGTALQQKAVDLIDAYRERTDKLDVRFLDPARNPAQARAFDVEVSPTLVISSPLGKARVTPSTVNPLTEEELTNALIEATSKDKPVVCFTTGHGEKNIDDSSPRGFQMAADALGKQNVEIRVIKLLVSDVDLDGCDSILVAGPTHSMLDPEVTEIANYLDHGGKILVLREARTACGLEPLLERYGLKANDDLIVDVNPLARVMGGSPAMPVVYEYGTNPIVRDFQGLATIFPTVGSVDTIEPTEEGVRTESLARTSEKSWGEMGDLSAPVSLETETERTGPLNVAAVAVRRLRDEPAMADSPPEPENGLSSGEDTDHKGARETRIVLFGDSDFASNGALMSAGNKDLLMNTVAWLNARSDLVSIRPKGGKVQQLMLTSQQWMILLVYSLVMLPALLITEAVSVFVKRRRL